MEVDPALVTPGGKQSKRWFLTCQVASLEEPRFPVFDGGEMLYLCYQLEAAPSTGQLHWHAYVRFEKKKRFKQVQDMFVGANVQMCKGNERQCVAYCTKEESFVPGEGHRAEFGERDEAAGKQGRRTDLDDVAEKVRQAVPMREIAEAHPSTYIKYFRGISALKEVLAPPPPTSRPVKVAVLWGEPGTGKTYRVRNHFSAEEIYMPTPGDRNPWDNYNGEKVLFLDEFNPESWSPQQMNLILDSHVFTLPCRYQNKKSLWEAVVICTNLDPMGWYQDKSPALQSAVRRRLGQECFHVTARDPVDFHVFERVPRFSEYGAILQSSPTVGFIPAAGAQSPSPSSSPVLKRARAYSPDLGQATQLQTPPLTPPMDSLSRPRSPLDTSGETQNRHKDSPIFIFLSDDDE